MVNKDFIKDVLAGKKQLMKKGEVMHVQIPHYEELSVRRIYPMFKKDPTFQQYFPDRYNKDKGPPRQYFFNILATLYPEYLKECVDHACEQRMSVSGAAVQKESIKISQFWEEELKSMPYLTQKNGSKLSSCPSLLIRLFVF